MPAGERGVPPVGTFDAFAAARLHDYERPLEFLGCHHEGLVTRVFGGVVRIDVVGNPRQHEIAAAAFHEGIAFARTYVPAAEHFRIELGGSDMIAHPDREMQDSDSLDGIDRKSTRLNSSHLGIS